MRSKGFEQARAHDVVHLTDSASREACWPRVGCQWTKDSQSYSPRHGTFFFAIACSPGTVYVGSCGIALNSTTRRHPRLGLVAGSRGPAQIHIRGLCHWAGEPAVQAGGQHPPTRARWPRVLHRGPRVLVGLPLTMVNFPQTRRPRRAKLLESTRQHRTAGRPGRLGWVLPFFCN